MNQRIVKLRNKIDALDEKLMDLIKQRLELVQEIGRIKAKYGIQIRDPEREAAMITKDRAMAEDKHISADLVENILRLLFNESYIKQTNPESTETDIQKFSR